MGHKVTTFFQVEIDLVEVPLVVLQEFIDFLKIVYDHVSAPVRQMVANIQIVHQGRRSDMGLRVASRIYRVPYRLKST